MPDSEGSPAEQAAVTEDQIKLDGSQWDAQEKQANAERDYVESIGADGNPEQLKAAEKRLAAAREQRGEGPAEEADLPDTPSDRLPPPKAGRSETDPPVERGRKPKQDG